MDLKVIVQEAEERGLDIHLKLYLWSPFLLFPLSILWSHLVLLFGDERCFLDDVLYLCCIYVLENSHIPVMFAAKEQDYTTNNPVETSTPTSRNISGSMKLKLTRQSIRLQIAN